MSTSVEVFDVNFSPASSRKNKVYKYDGTFEVTGGGSYGKLLDARRITKAQGKIGAEIYSLLNDCCDLTFGGYDIQCFASPSSRKAEEENKEDEALPDLIKKFVPPMKKLLSLPDDYNKSIQRTNNTHASNSGSFGSTCNNASSFQMIPSTASVEVFDVNFSPASARKNKVYKHGGTFEVTGGSYGKLLDGRSKPITEGKIGADIYSSLNDCSDLTFRGYDIQCFASPSSRKTEEENEEAEEEYEEAEEENEEAEEKAEEENEEEEDDEAPTDLDNYVHPF